jgi:hypothetical protein
MPSPKRARSDPKDIARRKAESLRALKWQREHRKRTRATNRRGWKKNKNAINERRREKTFRFRARHHSVTPADFSILMEDQIRRPVFRFVDTNGKEHIDKWETAEELAARYRTQKRGPTTRRKQPQKPTNKTSTPTPQPSYYAATPPRKSSPTKPRGISHAHTTTTATHTAASRAKC